MLKKLKTDYRQMFEVEMIVFLVVLVILACTVAVARAAEIRVGGAADACNGMFGVINEQIRDETGAHLLVPPSSSAEALLDLDRGSIDLAATDVPLNSLINDLEKMGYLIVPESFQAQGIGTNRILVYLNKDTKVTALSQGQLSDIFTGKITNGNSWVVATGKLL